MKGKDILKKLSIRSTNPGVRFEEILRKILPQVMKDQGKPISFNFKYGFLTFDFVLGKGYEDYNKPIFAEIKYYREKKINVITKSIDVFLGHPRNKVHLWYSGTGHINLNYILFIVSVSLTEKERQTILDRFKLYVNKFEIIIWDIDDLDPLFQDYAEYIIDLVPELKDQAVKNIVDKSLEKENANADPELHFKNLKKAYENDDLILFLGAGVSIGAGLPSWDGLMSHLLLSLIEKKFPEDINTSLNDNQKGKIASVLKSLNIGSPLQAARYINSGLADKFENEVSKVLYRGLGDLDNNDLLNSLVRVCTPPRAGIGIKAITNYNFDDLIETVLEKAGIKNLPVYNDSTFPGKEEIGIYHVHGFLPQDPEKFENLKESLLIFSEENYHTIMSEPYNWSNLTQLNFFRENTCLFIGQSGTDPNLRRLLEIAKQRTKKSRHYIILKRTNRDLFMKEFKSDMPNDKTINAIVEVHHKLQEVSFDQIGLNIIWIDNYNEIDGILNRVKN